MCNLSIDDVTCTMTSQHNTILYFYFSIHTSLNVFFIKDGVQNFFLGLLSGSCTSSHRDILFNSSRTNIMENGMLPAFGLKS